MAKGFKHGAGGLALNFKVVGGTIQPTNPAENTVWVNTETDISGWVFSREDPESPSEGLVWIRVNGDTGFNALRKNGLYVYPGSCKQYIGGMWVNVFAYIYQSGAWVQFSSEKEYLIHDGVIDMDAHTHSSKDSTSNTTSYSAENGVTYSEKASLKLKMANGAVVTHTFASVTVPDLATTMYIQYYLLAAYQYDPKFKIGDATVSVSRGSSNIIDEEGIAQIDVTGIAGTTVSFSFIAQGYSQCYYSYIGNAWFE